MSMRMSERMSRLVLNYQYSDSDPDSDFHGERDVIYLQFRFAIQR